MKKGHDAIEGPPFGCDICNALGPATNDSLKCLLRRCGRNDW